MDSSIADDFNTNPNAETDELCSSRPSSVASNLPSSVASSENDMRPTISGVSKRNKRKVSAEPNNSEQLKKAFDGLEQCLETIASVKADDEFQIMTNYMAAELRAIPNIQVARRFKRKLQVFFTNGLMDVDNELV